MIGALTMAFVHMPLFSLPAAYIDPNTGGIIFQVLILLFGVASGVLLFFSGRIKKAYFKIRRKMGGSKAPEPEATPQEKESS
jgi:hypothetical protein